MVALMGLGAALRALGLERKPYWYDEVATVFVLDRPLRELLGGVAATEGAPPLYYVAAWLWTRPFGSGEVPLRSLSLLFSTAVIGVAYLIGRELVSRRVGVIAAALAAVNPLCVWFGQEARAYALFLLLGGLSFLLLLRALKQPTPGSLLAWGVVSALALSTHYYAGFLVGTGAVWLLAHHRRPLVVAAAALPALAALALLPLVHRQSGRAQWIQEMGLAERALETPAVFLVGFETPAPHAVALVAATLAGGGAWLLLRRTSRRERRSGLLAAGVGLASLLAPLVVAAVGVDYFLYRNVLASSLPLAAALAVGYGAERAGRIGLACAAALCALSVAIVVATSDQPKFGHGDWRAAAADLGVPTMSRAVVVTPRDGRLPLLYYLPGARLADADDRVELAEIYVVAGATRPPGSVQRARPPDAAPRPAPPRFPLADRSEGPDRVVVRYRSHVPREVRRAALERLALGEGRSAVLVQHPAAGAPSQADDGAGPLPISRGAVRARRG